MTGGDNVGADLRLTAEALGAFAGNEDRFRALVDAFRAWDASSFQRLLQEEKVLERCDLVCEWARSKDCVLLCLDLAGPSPEAVPSPLEFASVVERIVGDEELVERLASAVSERDPDAFASLVRELEIQPYAHLLCHWVCTVHGRLICRVLCAPEPVPRAHLLDELAQAGQLLRRLAEDRQAFAAAAQAAAAGNCEDLRTTIAQVGLREGCEVICEWFCSWRCVRVCLELCQVFPPSAITDPLSEAYEFAGATAQLARQPEVLARLSAAVSAEDAKAFEAVVNELGLQRFCTQLCHWVCRVTCHRFCLCVCPNPELQPWFTTVGYFNIYADLDAGTGETNKSLPYAGLYYGGGPNFAFFGDLQLGGFCPTTSPSFPGVPMKYRFLYDNGSGPLPVTGATVSPVEAGTRLVPWPPNVAGTAGTGTVPTFQTLMIAGAPEPDPIPPAPGAPWAPPSAHVIVPDGDGWVTVDPSTIGGGFPVLIGFRTLAVVPGGNPGAVTAGGPVPVVDQRTGTDLSITFEATRVGLTTVDFSNTLAKIHINNWAEVNQLWFVEYGDGNCCTPVDASLGVQFTVDHEEMASGAWSLAITSCSPSAPGDVTPTAATPGVTLGSRGGYGTITEDTSAWGACSYTVTLTTRPGLTTGLLDRTPEPNSLTFCICGH